MGTSCSSGLWGGGCRSPPRVSRLSQMPAPRPPKILYFDCHQISGCVRGKLNTEWGSSVERVPHPACIPCRMRPPRSGPLPRLDDLVRFCCQNPDCPPRRCPRRRQTLGLRRSGKQNYIRVLDCKTCKERFFERKGPALFHCLLPQDEALAVFQHLGEGCGIPSPDAWSVSTATPSSAWPAGPDNTPTTLTTRSWLFPPRIREVQCDEKLVLRL